jgi:hypothetical protein
VSSCSIEEFIENVRRFIADSSLAAINATYFDPLE